MVEYYYYPTKTGAKAKMIFIQCDAVYVDPLGNRMRCDLKAKHKGSHQCGGTQVWVEWEDENEPRSETEKIT